MAKHTKGPWWNSGTEVGDAPMMNIKVCVASGANHEEAIANAKLIAKAPELLEIAHAFIRYMNDPAEGAVGMERELRDLDKAKALVESFET